jgi:outer membrane receptor protein involved in Fe transport
LSDVIQQVSPTGLPPAQYQNTGVAAASGVEASIDAKIFGNVEASANVAFQKSGLAPDQQELPDSPHQVHKGRIGLPLAKGKLFLGVAVSYISDRRTLAGDSTGSALVADFTFTTIHLTPEFDFQAGIRNAFNDRYYDPVGIAVDRMLEDGRSAYLKLVWHARE